MRLYNMQPRFVCVRVCACVRACVCLFPCEFSMEVPLGCRRVNVAPAAAA
jgi:hypothetical protein